jgi:hypothetical protein
LQLRAAAQEGPRAELFGGYEYLHLNPGGTGCHGFGANLAYNLNNWLAAVGDLGVCKETGGSTFHNVNYLFGPRFHHHSYGKVTPFAQVLLGDQHAAGINLAFDSFAMTLGGGADYNEIALHSSKAGDFSSEATGSASPGLKPHVILAQRAARLKSCPDT